MAYVSGTYAVGGREGRMVYKEEDGGLLGCGTGGNLGCFIQDEVIDESGAYGKVAAGTGAYERVEEFRYVGAGGNYERERILRSRCNYWCCLLPVFLAILVAVIVIIVLLPRPVERTTTRQFFEQDIVAPPTTTLPFDCHAGYWNWEKGWSEAKKRFCCDTKGRGCPVITTSLPFDCDAGYSNWQNGWSEAKKSWCCSRFRKGCMVVTVQTSLPYDCHAGLSNAASGWSEGKKLWCCGKFSLGCPTTQPYDCDAGYSNWQAGWSDSKKQWCCRKYSRGCHITTSLPYDCDAGYSNWQAGWSHNKKDWCCAYIKRGCPVTTTLPYDCDAGYSNWEAGWSTGKKHWCCQYVNRGCQTTLPYDCDAGFTNWEAGWSEGKKHWCCMHFNRGCGTTLPYDCDAGYSNWEAGWSTGKKHWCCQHHNRGCPIATTTLAPAQRCQLWGDPHVKSFDHTQYVFYRTGDFWIVKSPELQIQGRFQATEWTKENDKTDYASMTGLIISGSLMNGHKIEIEPMENNGKIICDGTAILHGFGTDSCGSASLKYGQEGMLIDSAMSSLPHRVLHVTLPSGIIIQANRWPNFMNAMIIMRPIVGQDGVCGNNNGDNTDDTGKLVHERFGHGVPSSELLFSHPILLHVPTSVLPSKKCTPEKRHHAEEECKSQLSGGWALAECMSDVCAGDHPVSQPQIYDCQAGDNNWRAGWSEGKKKFCCVETHGGAGCN